MDTSKPWWKSRTILSNIVSALITLYISLQPSFGLPGIPAAVIIILNAFGIYGRVAADTKIGSTPKVGQ